MTSSATLRLHSWKCSKKIIFSRALFFRLEFGSTTIIYRAFIKGERMKYRAALRRLCIHCRFVLRERRLFVVCSANQRHKQGQIKAKKSSD